MRYIYTRQCHLGGRREDQLLMQVMADPTYVYPFSLQVLTCMLLICGILVGTIGNLTVIALITKTPKLRNTVNAMVISICIMDTVHLLCKGSLYTKKILNGNIGLTAWECWAMVGSSYFTNIVILVDVAAIAIYRSLKITGGLVHGWEIHDHKYLCVTLGISVSLAAMATVVEIVSPDAAFRNCVSTVDALDIEGTPASVVYIYVYAPLFGLIALTVVVCYVRICIFTQRHRRKMKPYLSKVQRKTDVATSRSLVIIMLLLVLGYLPFIVLGSIDLARAKQTGNYFWIFNLRTFCVTFNIYSSVINPFVYFYGNQYWRDLVLVQLTKFAQTGCLTRAELHDTEKRRPGKTGNRQDSKENETPGLVSVSITEGQNQPEDNPSSVIVFTISL